MTNKRTNAIRQYTDIGHRSPEDAIWLFDGRDIQMVKSGRPSGQIEEPRTHHRIWGAASDDLWHGRYEAKTGLCSIVPAYGEENFRRPPAALLELLKSHFSVVRFYFFAGGVESFSPNPGKEHP